MTTSMRAVALVPVALLVVLAACSPSPAASDVDARAVSDSWRNDVDNWTYPAPLPPSLPLVDHTGRRFTLGELEGAPLVVGFVFTRCPVANACPLTMSKLAELERTVASAGITSTRAALKVLVVSIDPDYDSPAVLAAYRAKHGVSFPLATGERDVVDALASMFNVVALRRNTSSGDIDHPVKLALLDANLAPVRVWSDNNFTPAEIVDASAPQ